MQNITVKDLSTAEKISLLSGKDSWQTKAVDRVGMPSVKMCDGPLGLRNQNSGDPIYQSVPATALPSPALLACSFDTEVLKEAGKLLGGEARDQGVDMVLAPAVNIKRSPLCGRNFEYYSEDPVLSSHLAAAFIEGVQSQGVGSCIKHFAVNNQEDRRLSYQVKISERALHEIYLKSFRKAIVDAKPWAVMAAYNGVNGSFCTQNEYLLTEVLRKRWGYNGTVISDWGAIYDRKAALIAGCDLEMPSTFGMSDKYAKAAPAKYINTSAARIVALAERAQKGKSNNFSCDYEANYQTARRLAGESIVLLKNDGHILPLHGSERIGVIGPFANDPRFLGGGSSHVIAYKKDTALEEIRSLLGIEKDALLSGVPMLAEAQAPQSTEALEALADEESIVEAEVDSAFEQGNLLYAPGYLANRDRNMTKLIAEAESVAAKVDKVVYFMGLPESWETEGKDRTHLRLPDNQIFLLKKLSAINPNIVVVITSGGVVDLSFDDCCKGLIFAYLAGEAGGGATADVLFGVANPSGRLSETVPHCIENTPAYCKLSQNPLQLNYAEDIFVGYRWYTARKISVKYPFGYGLSYTEFSYRDLRITDKFADNGTVTASVTVTNSGRFRGKEVVQLYVAHKSSSYDIPERELKRFQKVMLAPGESTTVSFTLDKGDFSYYNEQISDFTVEGGMYELEICADACTPILSKQVELTVKQSKSVQPITSETTMKEILEHPVGGPVISEIFALADNERFERFKQNPDDFEAQMFFSMPLKGLPASAGGKLDYKTLDMLIKAINKKGIMLAMVKGYIKKMKKKLEEEQKA
ncbi:MAG: glycoside hydrolase family 3 C-terminal domain-containing protein [Clostridia bacterium]|nr:glycoside hydrolase family 3 C-terminal domain-containing protein [Clostridia bacterium]